MYRIMYVCHGNICRSPMGEFICKHLVKQMGLTGKIHVSSSATSTEEIGNPVYPPARREMDKRGIPHTPRGAVQITRADGENYHLILCMDDNNIRNLRRILRPEDMEKVKKIRAFSGFDGDVADPWYTGDFTTAFQQIYNGTKAMLEALSKGL